MTALTLGEAVPLGYALVARVARDSGVRALAIKGPVPAAQDLRLSKTSIDVDVWVDPTRIDDVIAALAAAGWAQRVVPTSAQILPLHSVTVAHPGWPCEADVHHWFPGFTVDPGKLFDLAWRRRSSMQIAGTRLHCSDPVMTTLLLGLHDLRSLRASDDALASLAARVTRLGLAESAGELALETGSAMSLAPLLTRVGQQSVVDQAPPADPAWRILTAAQHAKTVPALFELTQAPWRRRPRLVVRSLLLTEAEIRERQPHAPPGWWGLQRARVRRLGWGVAALPSALRTLRKARG